MNFMEMFLALMAIVLFTTISLLFNRSMWDQAENLDNVAKVIQATQLAHSVLDEIDAKLLSQQLSFAENQTGSIPPTVRQAYDNVTETADLTYPEYVFTISYNHEYCDSLGLNLNDTYNADAKFIKVTATVASNPGMDHPVFVSRIYTKTNFYLDY